jgi:hypothetical protein
VLEGLMAGVADVERRAGGGPELALSSVAEVFARCNGDLARTKAAAHDRAFAEAWRNVDTELQPGVATARRRFPHPSFVV